MIKSLVVVALSLGSFLLSGCAPLSKMMVASVSQDMKSTIESGRSRVHDPQVTAYFNELGGMVLESARRLDRVNDPSFEADSLLNIYDRFDVYVVHDAAPNAFVMGDDWTTINSALISMAESPEELVMVLGHEFGHMRRSHQVDRMTRVQYAVVAAAVAGTVAESAAEDKSQTERERAGQEAAAMAMAVCLPHTPENEHESDATGVEIMADLGLDLQYADDFFVRMLALYGDGTGSHPKPSERIAKIRAHAAQLEQSGYKPTRVMDRGAFLSMRARVRRLVKDGVESGTIVYWSQEIAQKSQQQALVQPLGCGPLYADPKTVADAFYKSAGVR